MKTKLSIIAALFAFTLGISAQTTSASSKEFKHGIGLAAGATSGYGLSYQYFPEKVGVQLIFGGIKYESDINLSLGLILKYEIIENQKANLYLYQSNSLYYSKYEYEGYDYDTGQSSGRTIEKDYTINNGFGVGTDISMGKRLSLNVMGGVGSYDILQIITVTGEVAVFYRI
ncbi:hypothetical protein [Portibacter marinus]|uniref:hypothetical protein n=1 Tax=Portibacter marinus TaxID=2898660 RepID=UPI001F221FA5|nr:hypothetical protein [Portibacter marinus]